MRRADASRRCTVSIMTGESRQRRSVGEWWLGRPRLRWTSWLWLGVGLMWLVLAITEPSTFHVIAAVLWGSAAVLRVLNDRRDASARR